MSGVRPDLGSVVRPASMAVQGHALQCEGAWTFVSLEGLDRCAEMGNWPTGTQVVVNASGIQAMDTGGAVMLSRCLDSVRRRGGRPVLQGLRAEHAELLEVVETQRGRMATDAGLPLRDGLGSARPLWARRRAAVEAGLLFLGESTAGFAGALLRPTAIRWRSLLKVLEQDGVRALPITGLLTFLVGVVIAYQGAEQLRKFGTNIFIVDLVGISLLREIAPLIVAILVAGRSGSAYAAEIGTMKVTEELDAVRTMGISPTRLLVLPRTLGLVVALPLLTVYADIMGVLGGMVIAANQLDVSATEFLGRFEEAVAVRHFVIGLAKAPWFAAIIAMVGCYQGLRIRGGVDDVGRHTTISVVQSIFLVIIFDAVCSILLNWWHL